MQLCDTAGRSHLAVIALRVIRNYFFFLWVVNTWVVTTLRGRGIGTDTARAGCTLDGCKHQFVAKNTRTHWFVPRIQHIG